jgi:hypothetical protein
MIEDVFYMIEFIISIIALVGWFKLNDLLDQYKQLNEDISHLYEENNLVREDLVQAQRQINHLEKQVHQLTSIPDKLRLDDQPSTHTHQVNPKSDINILLDKPKESSESSRESSQNPHSLNEIEDELSLESLESLDTNSLHRSTPSQMLDTSQVTPQELNTQKKNEINLKLDPIEKPSYIKNESHQNQNLEEYIGSYWLVRIGVLLVLSSMVLMGYSQIDWILNTPVWVKVSSLYALSLALCYLGQRLGYYNQYKNYADVLYAGGLSGLYLCTYAGYGISTLKWITSLYIAQILLLLCAFIILYIAHRKQSQLIAFFAITACYYSIYVSHIHQVTPHIWLESISTLFIASSILILIRVHHWKHVPLWSMILVYSSYCLNIDQYHHAYLWLSLLFLLCIWLIHTIATLQHYKVEKLEKHRLLFAWINHAFFFGLLSFWGLLSLIAQNLSSPLIEGVSTQSLGLATLSILSGLLLLLMSSKAPLHTSTDHTLSQIHAGLGYLGICYAFLWFSLSPSWIILAILIWSLCMSCGRYFRTHYALAMLLYTVASICVLYSISYSPNHVHEWYHEHSILMIFILSLISWFEKDNIRKIPLKSRAVFDPHDSKIEANIIREHTKDLSQKIQSTQSAQTPQFQFFFFYSLFLIGVTFTLNLIFIICKDFGIQQPLTSIQYFTLLSPLLLSSISSFFIPRWNDIRQTEVKLALHLSLSCIGILPITILVPQFTSPLDQWIILSISVTLILFTLSYEMLVTHKKLLSQSKHATHHALSDLHIKNMMSIKYIESIYAFCLVILSMTFWYIYSWNSWEFLGLLSIILVLIHCYEHVVHTQILVVVSHIHMLMLSCVALLAYMHHYYILSSHVILLIFIPIMIMIHLIMLIKRVSSLDDSHWSYLSKEFTCITSQKFILSQWIYDVYTLIIMHWLVFECLVSDWSDSWQNHIIIALFFYSILALYTTRRFWVYANFTLFGIYIYMALESYYINLGHHDYKYLVLVFVSLGLQRYLKTQSTKIEDLSILWNQYFQKQAVYTMLNFLLWSTAAQCSFYIYTNLEQKIGLSIWLLPIILYGWIGFKYQEKHARYIILSILGYCIIRLIPMIWSLPSNIKLMAFFTLGLTFMGLGWLYHKRQTSYTDSSTSMTDQDDFTES